MLGGIGNKVPKVKAKRNAKTYGSLASAVQKNLVASALGVGRGGLGVAIAKTAIAGKLGVSVDLSKLRGTAKTFEAKLFSESQGRMLVSVRPSAQKEFEKTMRGVALAQLGNVSEDRMVHVTSGKTKLNVPLSELADAYRGTFKDW
jgi:phosphoribosylformylglycinamidine (FGAM) synthase-like enzyme